MERPLPTLDPILPTYLVAVPHILPLPRLEWIADCVESLQGYRYQRECTCRNCDSFINREVLKMNMHDAGKWSTGACTVSTHPVDSGLAHTWWVRT